MSRSDLILLAVAFAALLLHVLIFRSGRRLPRWALALAGTTGLALATGTLALSVLALWKPALVDSWGVWGRAFQHPGFFLAGLVLVSLGAVNWLGRAWHLRHQGGWAVFGRGLLGLIQLAVAAGLLAAGLIWLMGQMGDPGPKEFRERYGSRNPTDHTWPTPASSRGLTPSL
jgi:hypothetical protein